MSDEITAAQRRKALQRLQAGHQVSDIAADAGISRSTLYRRRRTESGGAEFAAADATVPAAPDPAPDGKMVDITGPGISDHWGVTSTDLGAAVLAPNGKLGVGFRRYLLRQQGWRGHVALAGDADRHRQRKRADPVGTRRRQ